MKVRNGLISNSSSSSFLIYGTSFDTPHKKKFNEIFTKEAQVKIWDANKEYFDAKTIEEFGEEVCEHITDCSDSLIDTVEALIDTVKAPDEWDMTFIGNSWSSVKDDETGAQFKERTEKELKKIFLPEWLEGGFGTDSAAWGC